MSRLSTYSRPFGTRTIYLVAVVLALLVGAFVAVAPPAFSATPVAQRVDLRVLVLDDNSAWLDAVESQLAVEGVPYTAVPLSSASRPVITPDFLASGDRAFYQAVISPDYTGGGLTADELSALRAYEARFGIREVDGYNWANPAIGLNYAGWIGDLAGETASVTAAGTEDGFGYLNGPVPFSTGSYTYLAEPLTATSNPPLPPGASFTTLVSAPIPGSTATGSVIGVYTNAGVEQMVITAAFNFHLPQFKLVAHGIVSWATRGVHFGYNRNFMTFHVDDGFADVATWDAVHKCTPGEDCPRNADGSSIYPEQSVRMTPEDVEYAVQWQNANDYVMTIPFNSAYAAPDDPLTMAFQANAGSFRWLNHGFEHIYQGCIQNFTVIPWQCATDPANGEVQYLGQNDIYNEIQNNIARGTELGLPFNPTEYLSGEHSGFAQQPQMPQDNPNFDDALSQAGILAAATDASREPGQRQVGSALTIPRHPTAIFYNAATEAQEVSEYNWFYTSRANGGSGYCDDNPETATCIAPLNPATGFEDYIVPFDAAYDLGFILSNDPRPFYAHTSNLTADRILYPLLEEILSTYRAGFRPSAPLVNLTLTEAVDALRDQTDWRETGMTGTAVSGYVENGHVTINNSGSSAVPVTVPEGTTVTGVTLESYGGELSGWLPPAESTTGTLPGALSVSGSTDLVVGQLSTITINGSGSPAPTMSMTGDLPTGVTFTPLSGMATISGTPASGTAGSYPITITSTSGSIRTQAELTLTVRELPVVTSASSATATVGAPFSFPVTTTGSPSPTLSSSGALPAGITFTANADGAGLITGTPSAGTGGTYAITFTAQNSAGTATQVFTLTVNQAPAFTSPSSASAVLGSAFSFLVTTTGLPSSTMSIGGSLPSGVTFTPNPDGTATFAGTPTGAVGTYPLTLMATNAAGTASQAFTLTVTATAPTFTSAAASTATVGQAFSFRVTTSGSPTPTVSRTGSLPTGITFTANADGTATLAGTPKAGTGRAYALTLRAQNAAGTVTQNFTLTVNEAPAITSATSKNVNIGKAFSFTVTTRGFPVASLSVAGSLPTGLTFTPNSNGTATLSGTAKAPAGTYPLTFTAANTLGSVNQTFTLKVR